MHFHQAAEPEVGLGPLPLEELPCDSVTAPVCGLLTGVVAPDGITSLSRLLTLLGFLLYVFSCGNSFSRGKSPGCSRRQLLCVSRSVALTLCDPMDGSPPGSRPRNSPDKNAGVGCHALLQGSS